MMLVDTDDPTSSSPVASRTRPTSSVPDSLGFPTGYFVIRNLATGRLWDVSGNKYEDGTMVHLFREKEASLVESART